MKEQPLSGDLCFKFCNLQTAEATPHPEVDMGNYETISIFQYTIQFI